MSQHDSKLFKVVQSDSRWFKMIQVIQSDSKRFKIIKVLRKTSYQSRESKEISVFDPKLYFPTGSRWTKIPKVMTNKH